MHHLSGLFLNPSIIRTLPGTVNWRLEPHSTFGHPSNRKRAWSYISRSSRRGKRLSSCCKRGITKVPKTTVASIDLSTERQTIYIKGIRRQRGNKTSSAKWHHVHLCTLHTANISFSLRHNFLFFFSREGRKFVWGLSCLLSSGI